MSTDTAKVGVTVWFPVDGLTVHRSASLATDSFVSRAGQSFLVDAAAREAATDREGSVLWDLSEEQQVQRFGRVMFKIGTPPPDFDPLTPGSTAFDQARENAYLDLKKISDPDEQRIAAARVRERFGVPSGARSRTLRTYS